MELEDIYSENDKYLIEEYLRNGTDDFYFADLGMGEALFVVPYKYVKEAKSGSEAIRVFKADLLSFQDDECRRYVEADKEVKGYRLDDEFYVVPLSHEEKISPKVLRAKVISKAKARYDEVIDMYKELAANSDEELVVSFADKDINNSRAKLFELKKEKDVQSQSVDEEKWEKLLGKVSDLAELGADKIADFTERVIDSVKVDKDKREEFLSKLADVVGSSKNKCKEIKENLSERVAEEFEKVVEFKDKVGNTLKRSGNVMLLTGLLGAMVAAGVVWGGKDDPEGSRIETVDKVYNPDKYILGYTTENGDYVDFMGVTHKDEFGNIKRINELRPEISAMLMAVEGLAEEAYKDGKGIPTIGSGSTTHIDNEGEETRVEMGDEMSAEQAMINKWKYVEKYLLGFCEDKVGRSLSDKEIYCIIGAGFCWGPTQFSNSSMYKAILNNEGEEAVMIKSSGFRMQKGLLKRAYFFVNCDEGFKNNCQDILNLPVYLNMSGEYIHSSLYDLKIREFMPCEQDDNGKFKRDKYKNDIPKTLPGNREFCMPYYNDKFGDILCDLAQKGDKSFLPLARLKDLMPKDMVQHLENKYKQSANTIDYYQVEQAHER
jgi:GH24 family phage-related lysozyme (muramidase)